MTKQITAGIAVIACVVLCAAVWPRSAEVGDLPAEPVNAAVSAEIEARAEEKPQITPSDDAPAPETETVAESEPLKTDITTEKETESATAIAPAPHAVSKTAPVSTELKSGDRAVIDGKLNIWIPGFGWIVDEGGGSVGTMVGNPGDELTGHKVSIMGGTVGSDGDINKQVGIMGGGNIDEDMYENGHKIGIMGGDESAPHEIAAPPAEKPEITGDVIYVPLQLPVTKDSTPPAYKPNGEPYNP
ncbi:MAG TPA: hypothetical protein VEG39_19530 [Clostridia bacterium]|nr:hypothetical protein [Clostridia bacterium]